MKTTTLKLTFILEKTNTGFSAYSDKYAIYTTGGNFTQLHSNILEASNLYFEEQGVVIRPQNIITEIDLRQFFAYYPALNAKFLARRIGMNETLLSQYVKGHKKPSKKQTERILAGIHEIGKELSDIRLILS